MIVRMDHIAAMWRAALSVLITALFSTLSVSCSTPPEPFYPPWIRQMNAEAQRMRDEIELESAQAAELNDDELCRALANESPHARDDGWVRSGGTSWSTLGYEAFQRAARYFVEYSDVEQENAITVSSLSETRLLLLVLGLCSRDEPRQATLDERSELLISESMRRRGRPLDYLIARWPSLMLPRLDDARLLEELRGSHSEDQWESSVDYEPVLQEIVRRGGVQWESALADTAAATNRHVDSEDSPQPSRTFAAQTALRRLQHKPDPIQVIIEEGKSVECTYPDLPALHLVIENHDEQRLPIGIHLLNGAIEGLWMEVWDSGGKRLAVKEPDGLDSNVISHPGYTTVSFGKRRKGGMLLCDRVNLLPPGQYTVVAYFSEEGAVDRSRGIEGLFCSKSEPLVLTVKPIVLRENRSIRLRVRDLVRELDRKGPVKIIAGTYGPWAEELVPRFTAQEQLLRLGPNALPELLDILARDDLTPRRRAWVLSLLFSITGLNNPTENVDFKEIIGGYYFLGDHWNVFGNGYRPSRWTSSGSGRGEPIDVDAQRRFAERWNEFRQYIQVKP